MAELHIEEHVSYRPMYSTEGRALARDTHYNCLLSRPLLHTGDNYFFTRGKIIYVVDNICHLLLYIGTYARQNTYQVYIL